LHGIYGIGIVCMMLNRQNRRLGDYVAGTVVVHDKRTQEVKPEWVLRTEPAATNSQLALVPSEELVLIETYLYRRAEMDLTLRDQVAFKIATRISGKTDCSVTRINLWMIFSKGRLGRSATRRDSAKPLGQIPLSDKLDSTLRVRPTYTRR
jgi:hypothetical protein